MKICIALSIDKTLPSCINCDSKHLNTEYWLVLKQISDCFAPRHVDYNIYDIGY